MDQTTKLALLTEVRARIGDVRKRVFLMLETVKKHLEKGKSEGRNMARGDQLVQEKLMELDTLRLEQFKLLYPSPYFTRCDIKTRERGIERVYFGKAPFLEENIYSWVAPASKLRYENPGTVAYVNEDGETLQAELLRKDSYLITNGELKYFTTESKEAGRTLVFQEYFSTRMTAFALPEIIERMERQQDQVIRAHYRGPMVIAGPAGSGKTTLALHRIAYLLQSPDHADKFSDESTVVFVQDERTREYFSALLPELGIHGVTVTTFGSWASKILEIDENKIVDCCGSTELEQDRLAWNKLGALRAQNILVWEKLRLRDQYDHIDLTILLQDYLKKNGALEMGQKYYISGKHKELFERHERRKIEYSLMVIDEYENYLPEQLELLKSCLKPDPGAIMYVGDTAQRTVLGSVQPDNTTVPDDRKITLQKVYRNTKQILEYISRQGYQVTIPKEVKSGPEVIEKSCASSSEEIEYIDVLVARQDIGTIGILAQESAYLDAFKARFVDNHRVTCLTLREVQGVEFDAVCLVGDLTLSRDNAKIPVDLAAERDRIHRDRLYVALTRAVNELHILNVLRSEPISNSSLVREENQR